MGDIRILKKFNALLHDVTLLNFVLVASLTKRYKSVTLVACAVAVLSVLYLNFSQTTIYSKKVYFRFSSQADLTDTTGRKLTDIVSEVADSFNSQNEVNVLVTNYKFVRKMAEKLVDSPAFASLDFNDPRANALRSGADVFSDCEDRECKVKKLESILPNLYTIESEAGTGRFILSIITRSHQTTAHVTQNFISAIKENRVEAILIEYDKQIAHTDELIGTSRKDISQKGGLNKLAKLDSLVAMIERQHDKMKDITYRLNAEVHQNHYQEIRLKTSETTAGESIESENKEEYERYTELSKKTEKIKQDINSLNSIPAGSRTPTDLVIIGKLESELRKSEAELASFGKINRNIAYDQKFIDSQINNQTNYEFDYKITKQKLQKLKEEQAAARIELDQLLAQKGQLDNELLALKPDLEYLKKMESKMVTLRMLKSGARSDIAFEDFGPEIASFKRNTLSKIIIFSFLFVGFLLFLTLIGIYIFDDRIFTEYEIAKCCDDLKIIGDAPTFE